MTTLSSVLILSAVLLHNCIIISAVGQLVVVCVVVPASACSQHKPSNSIMGAINIFCSNCDGECLPTFTVLQLQGSNMTAEEKLLSGLLKLY